jgi:hypothetical protein
LVRKLPHLPDLQGEIHQHLQNAIHHKYYLHSDKNHLPAADQILL